MAHSNRKSFVVYRSRQQTASDLNDIQALRDAAVSSEVSSASSIAPTQSPSKKSLFSVPVVPIKTGVLQATDSAKTHGGRKEDLALHDGGNDSHRSQQLRMNRSEPTLPYSQRQQDGAGKFSDKRQSTGSTSAHSQSCMSQGPLSTECTPEKMPTSNKQAGTERSQHTHKSEEPRLMHTAKGDRDCSLSRHVHKHQPHQRYWASTPNVQSAMTQPAAERKQAAVDQEQRGAMSHREKSQRKLGPSVINEAEARHVLHQELGHSKASQDGRESVQQRDQRSRFDMEVAPKDEMSQRFENKNAVKTERINQKVEQKQDERNVPKEATQKAEEAKNKTDVKRTDSQKCPSHHDEDIAHQTTLYVRIHKVITNIDVLGQILTEKVNTPGVELKPTETAIRRSDTFTYCCLTCDSHTAAKMLKRLILQNKRQFHPQVDCSFVDYQGQANQPDGQCHSQQHSGAENQCLYSNQQPNGAENQYRNSKQQQNQAAKKEMLKAQIQFEMKKISERTLLKHKKMVDDIEKKLDESKSKLGNIYTQKEAKAEIAAHERKLEELEKQKKEFTTAFDSFQARLMPMFDSDTYERDVKILQKKLGVECHRLDKALPMYAHRQDVVERVKQHPVTVLLAETGSGKSTQVVQYLMEAGLAEQGTIVCTQPRKVAVISLATHVAEELATNVGLEVGYRAGLKTKTSASTKIVYMTDHALLNECLKDPDLKAFSCVVVDEAHERSLYTDLLLTMVKRCIHNRPDLRVIITSATIDPDVFVNFFGSCPVMRVSGRAFPVEVVWEDSANEETDFENYVDAAVNKVVDIHRKAPPGDILVFLTSAAEIQKCCEMTQQRLKDCTDFKCLPLHGQLQSDEQQKVFKRLDRNARKIVYATNCAETSITIDGIKYVVDTGVAKEMLYDARKGFNSLVVTTISKSSAEQRKGRAGRTASGTCYRLYSRHSFLAMDSISLPDILKIHLGHALLTLAQLGFTPAMYDFVQAPAQDAIDAALKTLRQLGALDDGDNITDTGQWIVRLPFDPKLGLIILRGQECGLLYDAIVLASVMNAGKGLFYRGTSEADRKKMDKARLKFSHQGGDGLSSLEVFKAWQTLDDRNKTRWCLANSVNAKAIRGVRESAKEVIDVLRKEVKLEIAEKFSDDPDAADKLRKIIFQCNISGLCHFLGKERAGYFAAQACRQVHFHPSSALCSLAYTPQWVVYDQLLKTSRDFITGITPVDDSWLEEVNFKPYGFDMDQVRQKKLGNVFTQPAGCHTFFAMIGPRYSKLRQYEELCAGNESGDIVVIEGSKEMGQLKVFSTGPPESVTPLRETLTHTVGEAVQEVKEEVRELTIGTEDSGLRVMVGQGGQLTDFLMPHETRKIIVTRPADDATEEDIRNKFEMFGKICYIHQFPSGRNWGFLVYDTPAEAETAAQSTKNDKDNVGELERRRTAKQAIFRAKLFWCRRPCNGRGFVEVSPAYMPDLLALRDVFVGNNPVTIKVSRKQPEDNLHLGGLPEEVSEDLVRRSLLHHLGCGENEEGIISRVTIIRNNVGKTTKGELQKLQQALQASFKARLRSSSVEVRVFPPKDERASRFSGEACFTDPIEGFAACKALQRRLTLNGVLVNIEPICAATVRIQRRIYEACKGELDSLFDDKLKDVVVEIENKQPQQNGVGNKGSRNAVDNRVPQNVVLHLKADNMKCIVEARTFINDVVKPAYTVDCHGNLTRSLMAPAGQKRLREIQSSAAAYICVDSRTRTVTLHGSSDDCTPVLIAINKYLDEVERGNAEEVTLRGSGQPPGLLKALINKYDEDLDKLRQDAGLLTITINYRFHTLKLVGPRENLDQAKAAVEAVSSQLLECSQQGREEGEEEESVDCVICLCPIDPGDLYRLEACAHPYCTHCLKLQVSVAIKDHQLPVTCGHEDCGVQLAWRDFNALARLRHIKLPDLASSALSAYVLVNRDKASFCATPNCLMAYRLTSEQDAKPFQCSQCGVRVCTFCKAQAHEGMTCSMLRSAKKERSGMDEWVSQNPNRRKVCPGCDSPIEKIEGCNKMMCGACKTIFCWLCRKIFPNDERCYKHLTERHGGVYTLEDILYDE